MICPNCETEMQDFSYLNKTLDVIGDLPLIPISIGLQCDSYLLDFKFHPETVKVLKRIYTFTIKCS